MLGGAETARRDEIQKLAELKRKLNPDALD
jgi:hypothetical protein